MSSDTWQTGVSADWSNAADWSAGEPSSATTVAIGGAGNYIVTLFGSGAAAALTLNGAGAEFYVAGALTLAGTLALQAGTLALAYGAIDGGTIAMQGGTLLSNGGVLNGVTVDGVLSLAAPESSLFVENGLGLYGANGSGAGSIALTGGYAQLDFVGSQVLHASTITIGASGSGPGQSSPATMEITHASGATQGATLTLGSVVWVQDQGGQGEVVVGSLSPSVGASLPDALINAGTISASLGGTLVLAGSGTLVNQGTLAVSNGALLEIATTGLQNTGAITVNAATLALAGTYTTALLSGLGSVSVVGGGAVELLGLANNAGSTLSVGAGSAITRSLGTLDLGGTLQGGTVADAGGGFAFTTIGGTLNGVTYEGLLALGATGGGVTLSGGTEVLSGSGGAGSLAVTGAGANLMLQGIEALNNATITLGAVGQAASIGTSDAWLASTATTATLGPQLTVQQGGAVAAINANGFSPISGFGLDDTLVNAGSILAAVSGGTLSIGGYGSFINQGAITVSGGDTLLANAEQFANAGTLTVGAGGTLVLGGPGAGYGQAPSWSNSGQIVVNGGTLVLQGIATTAQLGSVSQAGGLVQMAGTLANGGSTLSLGGSGLNNVMLSGTITGGTIVDPNSVLAVGGTSAALLQGVSYQGTLSLMQAAATLNVRGGLSASGLVRLRGVGSELNFIGTQSFTVGTLTIGGTGGAATLAVGHDYSTNTPSILTLGGSINQVGALAVIGAPGGVAGDGIVNTGSINDGLPGGLMTLGGQVFTNQGQISVSNTGTLSIAAAQFSNTGQLSVTNASLALAGSLTLVGLGQMTLSNASVSVSGTLNLSAGTLGIGAGSAIGRLSLTGTLANGTIVDGGGGLGAAGAADLSGVTYQGLLDLSRPFANLGFSQGLSVTGQSGSGTGSILLTGAQARLIAQSTEALNNCAITLGSPTQVYEGQTLAAPELAASAGNTLTIGPGATINTVGTAGTLGDAALGQWTDGIVNDGNIVTSISGDTLTLGSTNFLNAGTITAQTSGILLIGDAGFQNNGTLAVGNGSVVQLSLFEYFAAPQVGPTLFSNAGVIAMGGGILHEMTGGGLFPNVPIANQAGGVVIGTGTVITPIANAGTIEALGGTLSVQGTLSGAGTLMIGAGATLDLATMVGSGQVANFASTSGTLRLDAPASFGGLIANFTGGDVIDLPGQTLTYLAISNGVLVVNSATGQYRISSTTPLTGALEAGRDGHGGATISFIPHQPGGVGGGPTVLSVYQPNMLFWTTPSGDVLQGISANMQGTDACNWSAASSLDITDMAPGLASLKVTGGTGYTDIAVSNGTHSFTMMFSTSIPANLFHLSPDGHGGTIITT